MAKNITADEIPWEMLKEYGITKERIEKSKNMDSLLMGNYTRPLQFFKSGGAVRIEGEAAIRVYNGNDGWKVDLQTVSRRPRLSDYIGVYGKALDDDQKKSLLDTGNAGSPVIFRDSNGNDRKVMVSLNPDTNRIVTFPHEHVQLPKENDIEGRICGVQMTEEQKTRYLNGEAVHLKGMTKKNGETFDACIQFSAFEKRAAFVTPEWLREMRKESNNEGQAQEQKKEVVAKEQEAADTGKKAGRSR